MAIVMSSSQAISWIPCVVVFLSCLETLFRDRSTIHGRCMEPKSHLYTLVSRSLSFDGQLKGSGKTVLSKIYHIHFYLSIV